MRAFALSRRLHVSVEYMTGNMEIGSESHITVIDKVLYKCNENYKLTWGLIVLVFIFCMVSEVVFFSFSFFYFFLIQFKKPPQLRCPFVDFLDLG